METTDAEVSIKLPRVLWERLRQRAQIEDENEITLLARALERFLQLECNGVAQSDAESVELEFSRSEDNKDILMNEPETLRSLYQEAADEDRLLAEAGIESYIDLLEQEEKSLRETR